MSTFDVGQTEARLAGMWHLTCGAVPVVERMACSPGTGGAVEGALPMVEQEAPGGPSSSAPDLTLDSFPPGK